MAVFAVGLSVSIAIDGLVLSMYQTVNVDVESVLTWRISPSVTHGKLSSIEKLMPLENS
jgi:hypothetical protein